MASLKEWFPHDYYASRDVRIMRLLRAGGATWYGLYWLTVEMLHCQDDVMEEDIVDGLQIAARCDRRTAEDFIAFAIGQELFYSDGGVISSQRVARNLAMRKDLSEKKRMAASKRWNTELPQPECTSNADAMQVQCHNKTGQDRIEEKTVVVASAPQKARPRTLEDVITYFTELGMPGSEASRFHDYYTANGWKVGRNSMKDWKAAARNWRKGYTESNAKSQSDAIRTAPTGIPESVVRLQSKPKLASDELERIRSIFLSKVSGEDE